MATPTVKQSGASPRPRSETFRLFDWRKSHLVKGPCGPYSPLPSPDSLQFSGSWLALERSHSVDLSSVGKACDRVYQAVDAHGHTWFVRRGGFGLLAFRERTPAELVDLGDQAEDMRCNSIPSYRINLVWRIAMEMAVMAERLRPERVAPRASRRRFKARMLNLAELQRTVLVGALPASVARERLKALVLER